LDDERLTSIRMTALFRRGAISIQATQKQIFEKTQSRRPLERLLCGGPLYRADEPILFLILPEARPKPE
jgi:hypothetical protein